MYIVPRELTSQIKPHDATRRDERTVRRAGGESSTGIVGEESERISWPTQKPTLLMTLSAVISGCYLSWLPGAHLLRITNLYTLLCRHVSLSRVSPSPALLSFPHPPLRLFSSLRHQMFGSRNLNISLGVPLFCDSTFDTYICIFKIYGSIKKFKQLIGRFILISNFQINSSNI